MPAYKMKRGNLNYSTTPFFVFKGALAPYDEYFAWSNQFVWS